MSNDLRHIRIKEHSFLAKLASRKLGQSPMAIVFGNCIHLYGVSRLDFLQDRRWLRHEMEHIRQFRKFGLLRFIILYLWESLRKGYYNNRFEIEARRAESDE